MNALHRAVFLDAEPLHVACVDDDTDILHLAALALEMVGKLRATLFEGGTRALQGLADAHPDVILLDVMMPGMDGPTTLKAISADPALSNIPVIFMTARVQASEIQHYLALGAAGVIAKPFEPLILAETVRNIFRQWKLSAQSH